MNASSPAIVTSRVPATDADEKMTADRAERKYLLPLPAASRLARDLKGQNDIARHYPPGFQALPGAQQFSTTIYFDTRDRLLFKATERGAASQKLRAREYYNLDPSLTQLVTSVNQLVRFDPIIWFELKTKRGHHVTKRRFGLPKAQVPTFLHEGTISEEIVAVQREHYGDKAYDFVQEVVELCHDSHQPFEVDCLVNYRRAAWQDAAGELRITLDQRVSFFEPPADLWTRKTALIRETLGRPAAVMSSAVVEVKTRGDIPRWLLDLLGRYGATTSDFSKFGAASRAVHG